MKEKEFIEFIKWAQKSPENRRKAINDNCNLIVILNSDKKLTDNELKELSGGFGFYFPVKDNYN